MPQPHQRIVTISDDEGAGTSVHGPWNSLSPLQNIGMLTSRGFEASMLVMVKPPKDGGAEIGTAIVPLRRIAGRTAVETIGRMIEAAGRRMRQAADELPQD